MSFATTLRQSFRTHIAGWLATATASAVSLLFVWGFPNAWQSLSDAALSIASPRSLLAALSISALAGLVLLAFLVPLLLEEKLFPKFGVYWDRKGNSYCPQCKKLTSQVEWAAYKDGQWHGLWCSCSPHAFVLMEKGEAIDAEDAMRRMQKDA